MDFLNLNSSSNFSFTTAATGVGAGSAGVDVDYDAECVDTDGMDSLRQFLKCFRYFLSKSILISCLVLAFAFATVVLNLAVILFIIRLKAHKTVFDQIFIGHCVVDALVGLLVIPNYCVYFVFGYWPLGKLLCHLYVSLDYTICHVGILHMCFVAYARLRSLQSPKKYHNESIISHAKLTMFVLWLISGLLWLPAVNIIINLTFQKRECYFNYDPVYIILQDSVAYLLPMMIILAITFYILRTLHVRNKRRRQLKRKKNMRLPKLIMLERKKAALRNQDLEAARHIESLFNKAESLSVSELSQSEGNSTVTCHDQEKSSRNMKLATAAAAAAVVAASSMKGANDEGTLTERLVIETTSSARVVVKKKRRIKLTGQTNRNTTTTTTTTTTAALAESTSMRISEENNSKASRLKATGQLTASRRKRIFSIKLNAYAKLFVNLFLNTITTKIE
jgi:hypothetical protein